jgi:hypothetical protein
VLDLPSDEVPHAVANLINDTAHGKRFNMITGLITGYVLIYTGIDIVDRKLGHLIIGNYG